ncbi:MAG: site-specific integrase, partial [Patescibacteria group bacterium]|nr:site-specific integrase [Patescibacteria group bacterium]
GQRQAIRFGERATSPAWASFKEEYLKRFSGATTRSTRNQYLIAFARLEEYHPIQRLEEVTPKLLWDAYQHWRGSKVGLYARNKHVASIKAAMRTAEGWGWAREQNWSIVKRDREPKGRVHFWTPDQLKHLFKSLRGVWETLARLGARAGLRPGEAHGLRWEDVDLPAATIHVTPYEGHRVKDYEARTVPIPADLARHLKALPRRGAFVLDDWEGGRHTLGAMLAEFPRLIRKAKLTGTYYTLRHSYAADLASRNVSLWTIAKLMGHESVRPTEIYAHLQDQTLRDAVARLSPL